MATFKAIVRSSYRKQDGTYRIYIRVTHNRASRYIPTPFYVTTEQVTRGFNLKDQTIIDKLSDYINFNSDTSSLSGGISGITEDTARQLEGIGNSMLMQQIIGNQHLEDINRHLFATVQVSWFNEMLQNSRSIKNATENLNSAISEMRDYGSRALRVTMS